MKMRKLFKDKKGIYYTLVSLIVIAMIIGQNSFDDNSRIKQRGDLLQKRAISMNNFLEDIEKDVERIILIGGYRSLLSIEKVVSDNQAFLTDFQADFFEMFINGTNNGSSYPLMSDASINDWESRINEEANLLNMNFAINANNVFVEHLSPWSVEITLNATIILSDFYKNISWNYHKVFSNIIPINDFEDPLYKINSFDKVTNVIVRAPNLDFVNDTNNDSTVFYSHLNNSYYVEALNLGPSFLMRFEGNISPSPFGIESLVNLEDFSKQELTTYDRSVVDYIYFNSGASGAQQCSFTGLPSWFKIDTSHINDYELDRVVHVSC